VFSFHKEELAEETYNLMHLRTISLSASGASGTGIEGEWTRYDTFRLLCEEVRRATLRIDGLLKLTECERKIRGETVLGEVDEADVEIAKQWRGFRDGYIAWYIDCPRYKLDFVRVALLGDNLVTQLTD
jgi:hypothetical protein